MTLNKSRHIEKLHQEAMAFAIGPLSPGKRDHPLAKTLFRKAFEVEREAANHLAPDYKLEPSRSVLHRVAAALAIECGEIRDAEKLIAMGLAGDPPFEIAEELRDLLEQVNLERHMALRGLERTDELQMSIEGKATGYGMAQSDEFVDRVQTSEKMIFRNHREEDGTSVSRDWKSDRRDYPKLRALPLLASRRQLRRHP